MSAQYALFFENEGPGLLVQEFALDFPRKPGLYMYRLIGPALLVEAFMVKFQDRSQQATNSFLVQRLDDDSPAVQLKGVVIEECGVSVLTSDMRISEHIKATYTEQQPHERRPTPGRADRPARSPAELSAESLSPGDGGTQPAACG